MRNAPVDSGSSSPATRLVWALTLVLAAVAFVLGYVGFDGYVRGQGEFAGSDPADLVYYTVQLFLVDPAPLGAGEVNLNLQIARFLAPLATLLALVQALALLFGDWFQAVWTRRAPHAIVIGSGPAAALLAENLVVARTRVVTVGLAPAVRSRGSRPVHVTGDPLDRGTLVSAGLGRASVVYAVDDDWVVNAAAALAASSGAARVYAQVEDEVLIRAMRDLIDEDSRTRIPDYISLETIAALELLDTHPPGLRTDGTPRPVVVAGSGRFALALLQELGRAAHHAGHRREVIVVTRQPTAFEQRHRGLRWQDRLVLHTTDQLPDAPDSVVYACWVDPDELLRTTLTCRPSGTGKVVLCLNRLAGLGETLHGKEQGQRVLDAERVGVFGILDIACNRARIAGALDEQLARALHGSYLANQRARGEQTDATVPWELLAATYRTSCRNQAADIPRKLAVIGAELRPAGPGIPSFPVADDQLEHLARLEHERWFAERTALGVRWGQDKTGTTHPDLLPWDELSAATQAKDIEFIQALPVVLAEVGWQIAPRRP